MHAKRKLPSLASGQHGCSLRYVLARLRRVARSNATQNLILAEYAVKYVEAIMSQGLGAFNRPESVMHRVLPTMGPYPRVEEGPSPKPHFFQFWDTEWESKQQEERNLQQDWKLELAKKRYFKKIEITNKREEQRQEVLKIIRSEEGSREERAILVAGLVEQNKVGNCGEQSYVAFKYLVTKQAPGLEIVDIEGGNHVFVAIGMEATTPEKSTGTFIIPPKWGPAAVVCDPWRHEWFRVESVFDWQAKMKRIIAETKELPPEWIDKKVAEREDNKRGYAESMKKVWTFTRKAYLAHPTTALVQLACGTGNPLKTLQDMRAPHYRGEVL